MKYVIISDIHGNLEAFQSVLSWIHSYEEIDKVVCLGDIVGYGADPGECIELTRGISDIIIAGNHDFAAVGKTDIDFFNPVAKEAAIWTGGILSTEHINFLKSLPLVGKTSDVHFVHSSLYNPDEWRYLLDLHNAQIDFRIMKKDILFVGHSHIPLVFEDRNGKINLITDPEINLEQNAKYIINPGSVGQPRDHDPRASFAVFDSEDRYLKIIRLDYNIQKAQMKIRAAGLPEILAERLSYGR